mmetsp:Transcript_8864/g.13592  ORF Transcript_8864/g.13592 Transcript_8864/m.13592 type:complete len:523 (+) Transcript_8864:65-1633(+)
MKLCLLKLIVVLTTARSPRHHRHWRADLIVNIPSVSKGLSNQRMRIVQDLLTASLLGIRKVRLPKRLKSRKGCHYDASCYKQYEEALEFWQVFDKSTTTKALKQLGLIVIDEDDSVEKPQTKYYTYHTYPIPSSRLSPNDLHSLRQVNASAKHLYLFEPRYCCTIIIPDSRKAMSLAALFNAALIPNIRTGHNANKVLSAFKAWADISYTCALHWRLDDDFVVSEHKLNPITYMDAINQALSGLANECGHALLLLGDIANHRLGPIRKQLNASFKLATKQTLFEHRNWSHDYNDFDDLVGAVDFDIGVKVDAFLGSPFSSFSVLVAAARGDILDTSLRIINTKTHPELGGMRGEKRNIIKSPFENYVKIRNQKSNKPIRTIMPHIDVDDRLSALFSLQFPHDWDLVSDDPCADFLRLGPKYAKRLAHIPSCPFDHHTDNFFWSTEHWLLSEMRTLKKTFFPILFYDPYHHKNMLIIISILILLTLSCCLCLGRYLIIHPSDNESSICKKTKKIFWTFTFPSF